MKDKTPYNTAIIYGALMRRPMFWRVPYDYLPIAFFILSFLTILFNPLIGLFSVLPVWFIGFIVAKNDPDGFTVFRHYFETKAADSKIDKSSGIITYDPF